MGSSLNPFRGPFIRVPFWFGDLEKVPNSKNYPYESAQGCGRQGFVRPHSCTALVGVSMIWFCCQENVVGAEIVKVLNRQSYSPQKFAGLGT